MREVSASKFVIKMSNNEDWFFELIREKILELIEGENTDLEITSENRKAIISKTLKNFSIESYEKCVPCDYKNAPEVEL